MAPSPRIGFRKHLIVDVKRTVSTTVHTIPIRVREEAVTMRASTREEQPDDDWDS